VGRRGGGRKSLPDDFSTAFAAEVEVVEDDFLRCSHGLLYGGCSRLLTRS